MIGTRLHYDESSDRLIVERVQDVEPIIENAARLRQDDGGKGRDMWHAGRIPEVIVEQYCKEHGVTFRDFITDPAHAKRILNNPDYSRFRVWEGRV